MDRARTAVKSAPSPSILSEQEVQKHENELKSTLESALKKHGLYTPGEIDNVMKSFKAFGVKAIEQLKYVSKEQLMEKDIPLVTASILKEIADAGGQRTYTGDSKGFWKEVSEFVKECFAGSLQEFIVKLVTEFVTKILPALLKAKGKA